MLYKSYHEYLICNIYPEAKLNFGSLINSSYQSLNSMNYRKILFFSIFTSVLFALSIFIWFVLVEKKTEEALKDYSMLPDGVEVVDKAILGRRERTLSKGLRRAYILEFGDGEFFGNGIYRGFRRGAISLVCTNQNNVLLIVQDFKQTRHGKAGGFAGEGFFSGRNFNGSKRQETEISNMTYLYRGYFDVYVSDPLSPQEINSILETMRIESLVHIGINFYDGGDAFTPEFNLSRIEQLINNCQE